MALNSNRIKNAVALYKSTQPNRFKFAADIAEKDIEELLSNISAVVGRSTIIAVLKDGKEGFVLTGRKLCITPKFKNLKDEIMYNDIRNIKRDDDTIEILSFENGWQKINSKEYTDDLYDLFSKIIEYSEIKQTDLWKNGAPSVTNTVPVKNDFHLMPDFGYIYKCRPIAGDRLFYVDREFFIGSNKAFDIVFLDSGDFKTITSQALLPGIFRDDCKFEIIKGLYKTCEYRGDFRCYDAEGGCYLDIEVMQKSPRYYFLKDRDMIGAKFELFRYDGKNYLFKAIEFPELPEDYIF